MYRWDIWKTNFLKEKELRKNSLQIIPLINVYLSEGLTTIKKNCLDWKNYNNNLSSEAATHRRFVV